MLRDFLISHRQVLIKRCQAKVAERLEPSKPLAGADQGVPLFLEQLANKLSVEQLISPRQTAERQHSSELAVTMINSDAALQGTEMLRIGFAIDQVVHYYGDVCQSITELAIEEKMLIDTDGFRILNRCLDDAIAEAVTSFSHAQQNLTGNKAQTTRSSLDIFNDEHRRLIDIAEQAFFAIKSGNVGSGGATSMLLMHTFTELSSLVARTVVQIRKESNFQ